MSIDSDVIRGHVDTIILKTLTTGDKYGYEIIKEIEQKSKGTYELKQPTLYSCLKRLENQGLISGYSKNSDIGGKRHYYKLTKKGRATYENSMQDWFNSRSIIDSLMGSKPEESSSNEDEQLDVSDQTIIDASPSTDEQDLEVEENEEPLSFTLPEQDKEVAQMVIDESSSITQEAEPRNFENVNLDEDDVALLGDYYKTDENQIDLFAENDFSINQEESFDNEIEENDVANLDEENEPVLNVNNDELDNDIASEEPDHAPQFKNFSGADLSKYKNSSASNYFDSISSDNMDFTPIIDDSRDDDDEYFEDKKSTENISSSSTFSSFNYFGNYSQFNDDDSNIENNDEHEDEEELKLENKDEEYEEKREFVFPSFRAMDDNDEEPQETNHETLHFGFGGYEEQENDDAMNFPSSFDDVNELDEESYQQEEVHTPISIFGEEEPETTYNDYYENNYETEDLSEPIYSTPETEMFTRTYISEQTTDIKPLNIGTYSEPEHKEKLNQLSSYTKANYETKPAEFAEETTRIEAKTITELKEDFEELGIEVRNYKRPEKEPLKDKKYLLVNKIKFATSWIVFGVMSLLLLGTYFLANNWGYNDLTLVTNALPTYIYYILAGIVAISIPVTYTVIYLLNKTKKVKPNYNAVISLIFALLFFVVCLNIVYTFNILNGFTKFTQTDYNHLLWLLPSVVSLVIVFQSIVYTILFKTRRFNA